MQLIDNKTRTVYRNFSHFLPVVINASFVMDELEAKFDTGAAVTIIGISKLYPQYNVTAYNSEEQRRMDDIVKIEIDKKFSKYKFKYFKSATDHPIKAIFVKSNNVKIGNINVPVFYYWLSTQVNVKRFLLWD